MIKKIVIVCSIAAVFVVAAVFVISSRNKNSNGITTVKVERGDIVDKAIAIGKIEPEHEIAVKSKISGTVKKLYVDVGDDVDANAPLIDISPNPTPLEFTEAKRSVEIAQVGHDNALKNLERAEELKKKQLMSQRDYDDARVASEEARLRLRLAEEKLSLIQDGHARIADQDVTSVVKSPVKGTVLERRVNEGDPVVPLTSYQAGTELFMLAEMRDLIFRGTVDEIDVGKLREGMHATIKIGALPGEEVKGTLRRISPKARTEENRTVFDVEVRITDRGDRTLRAGYSANAEVVIKEHKDVLIVPERLVHFKSDSAWVEVKNTKGEIDTIYVATGLSDGLSVEITSNLKEGDLLIERPPREIE